MSCYPRIYEIVQQIPYGRVATYGQIAELAGMFGKPRVVGYALFRVAPGQTIPWHRVVNAKGEISRSAFREGNDDLQQQLLESEGINFEQGKLSLSEYRWQPPQSLLEQIQQIPKSDLG